MVAEGTDPGVVTAKILRESAAFARENGSETGSSAAEPPRNTDDGEASVTSAAASVAVPSDPPAAPDAETAFRHGRLAVVAALVLVLIWVWIIERRNAGREKGV